MSTVDSTRDAAALAAIPVKPRRGFWRRFRRHRLALLGFAILLVFSLGAAFAPWIARHDPNFVDLDQIKQPPSASHILGTDAAGRDVFARLLFAGRVSLSVGIVAVAITSVIGTLIGLVSGYVRGWVDNLLQRFTELVMTFPFFFAVIILVSISGPSIKNIIIAMGALFWPWVARLVRGQVLSLREMEYVTAARAMGASERRIALFHVLPGVMPYVAVAATLLLALAILTEAALSFLGLGVQIPTPTWGTMMNAGQSLFVLEHQPWLWAPAGIAIGLTVLGVNFIGDGLRDALDPQIRID